MVVTLRPRMSDANVLSDCSSNSGDHNLSFSVTSSIDGAPSVPNKTFIADPRWIQLAIDGFDDILFINIESIEVCSAVDPDDPSKGIRLKTKLMTQAPSSDYLAPINDPTTGDFNGDGIIDVAWIGGNFPNKTGTLSVFFAMICPYAEGICANRGVLDNRS